MNRRPPEFTRTDPPVPYTTLFRSQPAGDRESKDDQRDRDRVDEEIAEPLRRDDVDIAKTQYEQERLAKAEPDEGEQKGDEGDRSEEHTSELQSQMRISYAVFCLNKKKKIRK